MLFTLALAIQPRMLVTFDENLQPLPVTVRVGQVSVYMDIYLDSIFSLLCFKGC
jgi:hypothetical protein